MERTEILERIAEIVNDVLDVEPEDITEESTFDDFEADSLDRLEIVTAIEDEFDVEIDDERLNAIASVADAIDAIEAAKEA